MQTRRTGLAVLVCGVVALAALGAVVWLRPAPRAQTEIGSVSEERTDYFCLFLDGRKIGHAIHRRASRADQVVTTESVHLEIRRIGVPIQIDISEKAIEAADGRPLGFEVEQNLSLMTMRTVGQVRPDGQVQVTSQSMGSSKTEVKPWPQGAVMAEGLRRVSASKGLKPGTRFTVTVYAPSMMQALDVTTEVGQTQEVQILGRSRSLTEVVTRYQDPSMGQVQTRSFVDQDLNPIKSVIPLAGMQIEMVASDKEAALAQVDPVEMVAKTLVPSPVELNDLAQIRSIRYVLRPTGEDSRLFFPNTDNQKAKALSQGAWEVTVTPIAAPSGSAFPYDGNDPALRAAVQPNAYLQSDDPVIQDLAGQAVGDAQDAGAAVTAIESFVAAYIRDKDMDVGYATAKEVAANKKGDCSEHAVLCAALCRAVGIPAQVVVGVAYVNEFGGSRHCFGGHAWAQAYVGGKWVCLDAAFKGTGRGGYDAGHIALGVGDGLPGDFFGLIGTLGQFEVAEVKVEP